MLSRTYPQTSRSDYQQPETQATERSSASSGAAPRIGKRTQLWLAFATVLLASWATWQASVWMFADWKVL